MNRVDPWRRQTTSPKDCHTLPVSGLDAARKMGPALLAPTVMRTGSTPQTLRGFEPVTLSSLITSIGMYEPSAIC